MFALAPLDEKLKRSSCAPRRRPRSRDTGHELGLTILLRHIVTTVQWE
jgi:hypothetical protein